jgi:hypothetical protein
MLLTSPFTIYDFNSKNKTRDWRVINDGVMGGLSSSSISLDDKGNGVFKGHVSLKNNGGFASLRHQSKTININNYSSFTIRIKGDGKNYQFRVKSHLDEYYSYKYVFKTSNNWETIEIPFNKLEATFRGRQLDMPHFPNKDLEEVGFLISNKKEEDFKLEIDFIELTESSIGK